jgi:hypothetical protein
VATEKASVDERKRAISSPILSFCKGGHKDRWPQRRPVWMKGRCSLVHLFFPFVQVATEKASLDERKGWALVHLFFPVVQVATEKASLDERKGATLEEMSGLVHQLTMKISERKARLAPIIKVGTKHELFLIT